MDGKKPTVLPAPGNDSLPGKSAGPDGERRGLNNADKTLLLAAALFCLALWIRFRYPAELGARVFLFCAEAALVGGVADWFAVTALFEKPLGFPWHTAILPQRRPEFMVAATRLIQQDFFSRRRLFSLLESYDWRGTLIGWLQGDLVRERLRNALWRRMRQYALAVDCHQAAERIAASLRHEALLVPLPEILERLAVWLRAKDNDRRLLAQAAAYLRRRAETPAARAGIAAILEEVQEKKLEEMGPMARFLASMAQAAGIVDTEALAGLIQQEALAVLDEVAAPDSELQEQLRTLFYQQLALCGRDPAVVEAYATVREQLLQDLPLTETIEAALCSLRENLTEDTGAADGLAQAADKLIGNELARVLALFDEDEALQQRIDELAYDIAARSALQAQAMIGLIAREVMSRMTDEHLNFIVRDKIEPDLIWIRMNGSIVGAIIGLGLCAVLEIFRLFL